MKKNDYWDENKLILEKKIYLHRESNFDDINDDEWDNIIDYLNCLDEEDITMIIQDHLDEYKYRWMD